MLPGTEIYTTWGKLEAETPLFGAGFGVSVGYLFASWDNFKLYGDIGFSSISVKSNKMFSDIVDGGPEEKAKWNLGGLQMQIRGTFGFWNKPKPKDDDDDDDDDDKPKKRKKKSVGILADSLSADSLNAVADTSAVQDTAKVDSAKVDSAKVAADSANVADSTKANVADSLGSAKDTAGVAADSLNKNVADSLTKNVAADTAKAPVMKLAPAAPATPAKQPEEKTVETTVEAAAEKDTPAAPATNVKSKGD